MFQLQFLTSAINTSRTFGIMACLEILVAWALAIVAYIEYRVKGYMVTLFASVAGMNYVTLFAAAAERFVINSNSKPLRMKTLTFRKL